MRLCVRPCVYTCVRATLLYKHLYVTKSVCVCTRVRPYLPTIPLPHLMGRAQQLSGKMVEFVQEKPVSNVHWALHPSPDIWLPSSHSSPFDHSLRPVPQTGIVSHTERSPALRVQAYPFSMKQLCSPRCANSKSNQSQMDRLSYQDRWIPTPPQHETLVTPIS